MEQHAGLGLLEHERPDPLQLFRAPGQPVVVHDGRAADLQQPVLQLPSEYPLPVIRQRDHESARGRSAHIAVPLEDQGIRALTARGDTSAQPGTPSPNHEDFGFGNDRYLSGRLMDCGRHFEDSVVSGMRAG